MSAADLPAVVLLVAVAWTVWRVLDVAAAAVLRRIRPGVPDDHHDELMTQIEQLVGVAGDSFHEAEALHEVAVEIRDDVRPDQLLEELRQLRTDVAAARVQVAEILRGAR